MTAKKSSINNSDNKSSKGSIKKFIIVLALLIFGSLVVTCVVYYLRFFGPNVTANKEYLYIHTGATFDDVYTTIQKENMVSDTTSFKWAAINMKYTGRVKPGKYRLRRGMSNRKLINMLASGNQEEVTLSFHSSNSLRVKEQFAGYVAQKLEPDSAAFSRLLDSADFVKQYGFTTDDVYVIFLPDSYRLFWNTSPEKFFKKMYVHYQQFWTPERQQQAADINLTMVQVSVLASIVDAEALHDDEMPTIAGLYLNRLKKGIKLEADPTVIFAEHDFTIKRVLTKYLSINSPYNTYLHTGLPPGPIMMPSVNALKAVLNYQKNDYLFMCAKEDFSGYHNFATNVAEHMANARRFQQALNERNIKR